MLQIKFIRILILLAYLGIVPLCAFSQSKLQGAGKASKVGASATQKSSSSVPKKNVSKNSTPAKKSTSKVDPNAKYASSGYMDITGLTFSNEDKDNHIIDDFGSNMYASEMKYLTPKLFYKGLASEEKEVELSIKIIKEDGSLEKSSNSPEGCTYKYNLIVKPGAGQSEKIGGWGRNSGGSYSAGQYTFEIWYEGNILYQKGLRLYSGSTPLSTSKIMKISSVSFANQDKSGKNITGYGEPLYEDELKYLSSKIYYEGLFSSDQSIILYYRIFKSTGSLSSGTNSPKGYTSKQTVTIKPGSNSIVLNGWGSESGGSYPSGVTKVEYWLDGEKIYETKVTIEKKEGIATYLTVDSKTSVSTSFGVNGGTETFYVKTDAGTWETWGVPSWCEIKNKTATSFTLTCKPNTTGSERSDYMKVKAGGKEVKISIKQSATDSAPSFGLG